MRKRLFGFAVAISVLGTSANAQLAGLLGKSLGLPGSGEVGARYQSKNQIRTYITSTPINEALLFDRLVAKAAEMAKAKGFSKIGVTKTNALPQLYLDHQDRRVATS